MSRNASALNPPLVAWPGTPIPCIDAHNGESSAEPSINGAAKGN